MHFIYVSVKIKQKYVFNGHYDFMRDEFDFTFKNQCSIISFQDANLYHQTQA